LKGSKFVEPRPKQKLRHRSRRTFLSIQLHRNIQLDSLSRFRHEELVTKCPVGQMSYTLMTLGLKTCMCVNVTVTVTAAFLMRPLH